MITYELDALGVTIHSSLPSRFSQFQIELNGNVVAEVGNGVTTSSPGNGWMTQSTALPLEWFLPGNVVTLTQQGLQSGLAAVVLAVTF